MLDEGSPGFLKGKARNMNLPAPCFIRIQQPGWLPDQVEASKRAGSRMNGQWLPLPSPNRLQLYRLWPGFEVLEDKSEQQLAFLAVSEMDART